MDIDEWKINIKDAENVEYDTQEITDE